MFKSAWIFCLLFIRLILLDAHAQISIPELKYTSSDSSLVKDTSLQKLRKENKIVVLFRTCSTWDYSVQFTVVTYGEDSKWKLYFGNGRGADNLEPVDFPEDSIIKIWRAFIDNDILTIRDEKDLHRDCDWYVFDAHEYYITILTKTAYKKLHYYAPEFFEAHCSSIPEAQKLIKWGSQVGRILKDNKPRSKLSLQ